MVTTRPPKTIVKPTALGPVANTDTKLLIYGLFQKGRVLAQDGVQESFRLHPEPELELVRGHCDEIDGDVLAREGVHSRRACLGVNLVELVFDYQLSLLADERVEASFELDELRRSFALGERVFEYSEAMSLPLVR